MKLDIKAKKYEVIALAIIFISALLVFVGLTRGHVWGDDFAGYLNQASAILGRETHSLVARNFEMNQWSTTRPGPDAYPWGYPLLLSPFLALFGLSPLVFKTLNILFWVIGLWAVSQFAKKRLSTLSAWLVLSLLGFSPLFIQMNDLIQSDIPFFMLVYIALWQKDNLRNGSIIKHLFFGIVIFLAMFTRTTGILLLALFLPNLYATKNELRKASSVLLPAITAILLFAIQGLLLPSGESSYFSHFDLFTWHAIIRNIGIYFQAGGEIFGASLAALTFYILCWLFFLFAQTRFFKEDVAVQFFFFAMLFVLLVWPEDQGARFLLPLLPIFLVRVFQGVESVKILDGRVESIFLAISALFSLLFFYNAVVAGTKNIRANRTVNGPFDPVSAEAFAAAREYSEPEDVLVFFKPRAAMLFTDRLAYASETCDGLSYGDLLLVNLKQGSNLQIEPSDISDCEVVVKKPIFHNKRFELYEIDRSLIQPVQ